MKKNTHKEFIISSEPFLPELLSGLLWELETEGIVEDENSLKLYANEKSDVNVKSIEILLNRMIEEKLILSFNIIESSIENKNWNEEWEKGITPIEVTDKIVIKPSFKQYDEKKGQIIITIDPKMSFGTGEHQTTKLVLQLLENYTPLKGKILDVGTGTGILAIAAIKLGAKSALAIDNDEWCIENAEENILMNDVNHSCKFSLAEINNINEYDFDLIIANIQKNVLIEIAPEIKKHLKVNGYIILSGLLIQDENDILDIYGKLGFAIIDKKQMDEWIAMILQLNKQP